MMMVSGGTVVMMVSGGAVVMMVSGGAVVMMVSGGAVAMDMWTNTSGTGCIMHEALNCRPSSGTIESGVNTMSFISQQF